MALSRLGKLLEIVGLEVTKEGIRNESWRGVLLVLGAETRKLQAYYNVSRLLFIVRGQSYEPIVECLLVSRSEQT